MKRPLGRPRQRRIESQFTHKKDIHCSRCNGVGHNRSKCTNPLPRGTHFHVRKAISQVCVRFSPSHFVYWVELLLYHVLELVRHYDVIGIVDVFELKFRIIVVV